MSKKLTLLIIIISFFVIIGLIFGIMAIYRFCVIQSIFGKIEENIGIENYYLKTTFINQKGEETVTEAYYREGIGKNIASNGVYTWVDGKDAYMVDEANKKIYILDIESENSISLVSNSMFASLVPGYNKNTFQRFLMACNLNIKIKSEKIDNKKYYVIEDSNQEAIKTVWISKDRKNPVKSKVRFKNGKTIEYKYELKFLVAKLKNVELPDISEYTLIDYETGDTILNKEENQINENTINVENVVDISNIIDSNITFENTIK